MRTLWKQKNCKILIIMTFHHKIFTHTHTHTHTWVFTESVTDKPVLFPLKESLRQNCYNSQNKKWEGKRSQGWRGMKGGQTINSPPGPLHSSVCFWTCHPPNWCCRPCHPSLFGEGVRRGGTPGNHAIPHSHTDPSHYHIQITKKTHAGHLYTAFRVQIVSGFVF